MDTGYKQIVEDFGVNIVDHTIETWSLSETVTSIALVAAIYLTLVVKILPSFMVNRPAYQLKNILLGYNTFQVGFSVYLVYIYLKYIYNYGIFTARCPTGEGLQGVIYQITPYFIAKHLDLLDTVFFVLRKKDNQITFLHLYHHTAMVTWVWLYRMYHPTDHFVVVGMLNSFVHILMYAYYGISSLGPEYSKFIWWKKHLTKVQLVQFILVLLDLHYQQKLTPCPIPAFFHNFCIGLICSFFILFMDFYVRSYRSKARKKREAERSEVDFAVEERLLRGR